jgi:hypothetical protein
MSELGSWKNERVYADIRGHRRNINYLDMQQFLSSLRRSNKQLTAKANIENKLKKVRTESNDFVPGTLCLDDLRKKVLSCIEEGGKDAAKSFEMVNLKVDPAEVNFIRISKPRGTSSGFTFSESQIDMEEDQSLEVRVGVGRGGSQVQEEEDGDYEAEDDDDDNDDDDDDDDEEDDDQVEDAEKERQATENHGIATQETQETQDTMVQDEVDIIHDSQQTCIFDESTGKYIKLSVILQNLNNRAYAPRMEGRAARTQGGYVTDNEEAFGTLDVSPGTPPRGSWVRVFIQPKKGKGILGYGKVKLFRHSYFYKNRVKRFLRFSPKSVSDEVYCRMFYVNRSGKLYPLKWKYHFVGLKEVVIASVNDGVVCEFNYVEHKRLEKQISQRQAASKLLIFQDGTINPKRMNKAQILDELRRRGSTSGQDMRLLTLRSTLTQIRKTTELLV